jgi:hypothetical protein
MAQIFDLTGQIINTMPERPGPNDSFFQGIAYDQTEQVLYVTQTIVGGIQLPGEGAPVSFAQRLINGDITVLRMTQGGAVTGQMYLTAFGHGQTLGVEHDPLGGAFIWTETDAHLDGLAFGTGRKIARVKFENGAIHNSADVGLTIYDPVPGAIRVEVSLDVTTSRLLYTYITGGTRRYSVYNLSDIVALNYTPIQTFVQVGIGGTFQSCCLHDKYVYQLEGTAYDGSNTPPGNTYISVIDIDTGLLVERVLMTAGNELTYREPEGLTVLQTPTGPQLVYSFVTHTSSPRFMTFFGAEPVFTSNTWLYTTRTVAEAPFAWNPLMERYRMDRGISVVEVTAGEYEEVRYDAYTEELGAGNLPQTGLNPDFWPQVRTGLHFFRGGYEHIVNNQIKNALIASGVADASNFTLIGGFGSGGFGQGGFGE